MHNMNPPIGEMTFRQLRDALKGGRVSKEEVDELLRPLREAYEQFSKQKFSIQILESMSEYIKSLPKLEDLIAPRIRDSVIKLAQHGWFVSDAIGDSDVFDLVEQNKFLAADKTLTKYFRSHQRAIKKLLSRRFPQRKQIFQQAFRAHTLKHYSLSVPIFLIQADGICFELLGALFFKKRDRKRETADHVDSLEAGPYLGAFLEPLKILLPITENTKYLDSKSLDFNRHSILHGSSTNYGTESNSLKSISLLHFLASFVEPNRKK